MLFNKNDEQLMMESRNTLDKLQRAKSANRSLFEESREFRQRADRGKHLYEVYDHNSNEVKMKIDFMYYNQFLQKLDESHIPGVETAMIELYKTINKIYEHINIKPSVYGFGITSDILNESIDKAQKKLSTIVYEYLDKCFYKLTPDERKNKYYTSSVEDAKVLISEGTTPEEAISYSIKTAVMENLLRNISFPFAEWSRISYLAEDEEYGAIFDKDTLVELLDDFKSKLHNMSKIVAACV